jgi:hypothetical protein
MNPPIKVTNLGRQALINAQNSGLSGVIIASAKLGSAVYDPTEDATDLVAPFKTIETISGVAIDDESISVSIKDTSDDGYEVNEIGFFTDTGVLFAVLATQNEPILLKQAKSWLLATLDIKFSSIDASHILFGDASFAYPKATESQVKKGVSVMEMVGPESMYFLVKRQKMNFFNLNLLRGA